MATIRLNYIRELDRFYSTFTSISNGVDISEHATQTGVWIISRRKQEFDSLRKRNTFK